MAGKSAFDEAADQLYSLPPPDFVPARDERVAQARQSGDPELAKALRGLRRPTQSAWLVNQLWRQQHEQLMQLLALGQDLRKAAQALEGDTLRRLSAQRHDQIGELLAASRRLAETAGIRLEGGVGAEVEATLAAAVADPDVAAEVESGRLVKAADYSGFGPAVPTSRPPSPRQRRTDVEAEPKRAGRDDRNRQAAEAEVDDARRRHAAAVQQRVDLLRHEEELLERRTVLRRQIRELDDQLTATKREAVRAESRQGSAEKELAKAERRLKQAARPSAVDE